MTYKNKLADPRWQKKRLKIFERDNWKCTECGRDDLELHVHHETYSGNPWDAPEKRLKTLCHICHSCVSLRDDYSELKKIVRKKYGMI